MRVQTHPCTREWCTRVGVTQPREGTSLMLRNDFVKNVKYKHSQPEAQGVGRTDTQHPPQQREGQQNKPIIVSLLSLVDALSWLSSLLHPSACCSLFPAQGTTLFPKRLPVYLQLVKGTDRRVGSGQRQMMVSLPQSGMCWLVDLAQQTSHQLPALPEGAMCISPPQASGPQG